MKLTILGSGVMFPTSQRYPSAFLLEADERKFLLDCGHGSLARLAEQRLDPREIHALLISHFHTDHAADAFKLAASMPPAKTYSY